MEEYQEADQPDQGLIARIQAQVDSMPSWVRTHTELASETVASLRFNPVEALKRSYESAKRHKKGIARAGALSTFGAGVTAAVLIPPHRR